MSIDLQDPISVGRSATQAVQRHASDAVDLARAVDLPVPAAVVKDARKRANRAAKRLERRVDRASGRATARVSAESRRLARATAPKHRGRRVALTLVFLVGGAAVVAVLARRMRQMSAVDPAPDPFGAAVQAADAARDHDPVHVTTG